MAKDKKHRNDLSAQLARLGYGGDRSRPEPDISRDEIRRAVKKSSPAAPREDKIYYRRDIPREVARPTTTRHRTGKKVVLEQAVKGAEVEHTGRGKLFVVSTCVNEIETVEDVSKPFKYLISKSDSHLRKCIASVCSHTEISHDDVIFMDVESTGLGNSPLFLIGIMVWDGDGFTVRQFFARNYAEEAATIASFLDVCAEKKLLITFNGKSFDFPYIRARAAASGVPFAIAPHHLDLLHVSRRIWKRRLPDCRLQTLETLICGRQRHGDIPGAEIPDAYHEYVRNEDAWQMVDVLKHNMLDLVTLADLMGRLPRLNKP
jgi:uncharacterized protein YprB with RNaseH-like and TPR domain